MVTYYNKKDLVSFGNYLLSQQRKQSFKQSYKGKKEMGMTNPISAKESSQSVHQEDIENWKHLQKQGK